MGMIAGRRTPIQPSNRLSRVPAFEEDSHLPKLTIRVHCMPYLTRDIAGNPIVLQGQEPNLTTSRQQFSHHDKFLTMLVHPHISRTY
jgi:hypothetical protein